MQDVNMEIIEELVEEVRRGEHEMDILPNSSFDFSEERQSMYFSNARKNMKSDMAYATMSRAQRVDDMKVFEVLG